MSPSPCERQTAIIEPVLKRNFRAGNAQNLRLVRPPRAAHDAATALPAGHDGCTTPRVEGLDQERVA